MKHFIATAALTAFAAAPLASFVGQDEAKRKSHNAYTNRSRSSPPPQRAQGAERDKLMQEHMNEMQETMGKIQSMKPRDGMTPPEQKEWMEEHQKLMQQMMGQMMTEHHIMMQRR